MKMGRPWMLRVSIAANFLLLTYLALYSSSSSSDYRNGIISYQEVNLPLSTSSSSSSSLISNKLSKFLSTDDIEPARPLQMQQQLQQDFSANSPSDTNDVKNEEIILPNPKSPSDEDLNKGQVRSGSDGVVWDGDDSALGEGIAADLVPQETPSGAKDLILLSSDNDSRIIDPKELISSSKLFPCDDLTPRTFYGQRGAYWVLYNYIRGERTFRCDQSITYTTHADYTFLDNLVPLLERWQGPLSLSVYAPGTDFNETLFRIHYLRECIGSSIVKDFVTFHIFFDNRHVPRPKVLQDPLAVPINCSALEFPKFGDNIVTYKKTRKLPYPVNVARNVAREMATTHYILPSDIELYPNPFLIPNFLEMVRLNDSNLQRPNPKVFVLSIFEVEANVSRLPEDKRDLLDMLRNKSAIPFHKYVCADCHRIPKADEWMKLKFEGGLKVFHVGKRHKPFHHWEPIFIGTKFDPTYDERLSWEGRSDKMTQGYTLCVLDYEFHILDNAFLVHRPGIKRIKVIPKKNPVVAKQNTMIAKLILPELKLIYGNRPGCFV